MRLVQLNAALHQLEELPRLGRGTGGQIHQQTLGAELLYQHRNVLGIYLDVDGLAGVLDAVQHIQPMGGGGLAGARTPTVPPAAFSGKG